MILRLCCRHWPCCFEVSLEKSWKLLSNVKLLFLLYVQKSLKRNGSQLHSLSIFQIGRFSFTFNCLILNVRCIHFYRIMRISFWISLFKDRSYLSSSMYIHMRWLYLESKKCPKMVTDWRRGTKWMTDSRRVDEIYCEGGYVTNKL